MQDRQHSVLREGGVVGLLGAVVDAVWILVYDVAVGQPLHTPSALGRVFLACTLTRAHERPRPKPSSASW